MSAESDKLPADKVAYTVIASLIHQAYDLGLSDFERICKNSLIGNSDIAAGVLSQHEVYTRTNKSASGTSAQWKPATGASSVSGTNMHINHSLRFVEDDGLVIVSGQPTSTSTGVPGPLSLSTPGGQAVLHDKKYNPSPSPGAHTVSAKSAAAAAAESDAGEVSVSVSASSAKGQRRSILDRVTGGLFGAAAETALPGDYEEVTNIAILNAPITDICISHKNESPPKGYYRLSKTPSGKRANVNTGSGGSSMYFCMKKDDGRDVAPITTLMTIFADRGEVLSPGYSLVRRNQYPCNFNHGTSGERVFLAYKRDRSGNPITDLQIILPGSAESTPAGFLLLDKSSSGQSANLNSGTGGSRVYVCYKQQRRTLRCLATFASSAPISPSAAQRLFGSPGGNGSSTSSSGGGGGGTVSRLPSLGGTPLAKATTPQARGRERTSTVDMRTALSPTSIEGNRIRTGTMDSINSDVSSAQSTSSMGVGNSAHLVHAVLLASSGAVVGDGRQAGAQEEEEEEEEEEEGGDLETADFVLQTSKVQMCDDLLLDVDAMVALPVTNSRGEPSSPDLCRALYAILAALQVRYAALAQTSIQGLMLLLKETDMFASDIHVPPEGRALTALHLTINAVCERLELHLESETRYLLFFLVSVVKYSDGRLHPANIQRIFKSISFIMQYQASKVDWVNSEGALQARPSVQQQQQQQQPGSTMGSMSSLFGDMPPDLNAVAAVTQITRCLFRPVEMLSNSETPDNLQRLMHCLPADDDYDGDLHGGFYMLSDDAYGNAGAGGESHGVAHEIVLELIGAVLDAVEMARITEVSQKIVSRPGLSLSSSAYWSQMNVINKRLFVEPHLQSCYMVLCWALKIAWAPVRYTDEGEPLQRDVSLRLMAFQCLHYYLSTSGELQRTSEIMGFQVRRLVVPCILANVPIALMDHRVFTKVVGLMSLLWKNWRVHTHLEFAILVEQLVIPVMQASAPKHTQPIFQTIVIQEVATWFDQPALLVEMFVNFDMDRSSMNHWNVFSHLVRTICGTAKQLVDGSGSSSSGSGSGSGSEAADGGMSDISLGYVDAVSRSVTAKGVQLQALEEACRIAKALMDAAGHAYLIEKDAKFRMRSVAVGVGWEDNDSGSSAPSPGSSCHDETGSESGRESPRGFFDEGRGWDTQAAAAKEGGGGGGGVNAPKKQHSAKVRGVRFQRAVHQEKEELLAEAIALYHKKEKNLIKAVQYLTQKGFMEDTPQDIAQFLRVYRSRFDPSAIGDFLGEGGRSPRDVEYWSQIRFRYTRALSWIDMDVEPALRFYLTGAGFRLPGEAQKVDRFVEVFVKTFWQDNSGTERCPFRHPDTVHLLTYAIIMLNTDHHRANVGKKHAMRKMSAEDFIKNLRGADMGHDIDPTYLRGVFEAVHSNAIELAFDDDGISKRPDTRRTSVLGSIAFAFAPPAAWGSIGSNGLDEDEDSRALHRIKFRREIEKNLRDSRDLMRSLSSYVYHFYLTGIDTNISLDLVSFMYETVWNHFRTVDSALLVEPNKDMFVTFHALDILCYSLTAAIFLGMRSQKIVLAEQLRKFQSTYCSGINNDWFESVRDCNSSSSDCMAVISHLHKVLVIIKDSCQEQANRDKTIAVASTIEKRAQVLQHNAYFVREGDVEKQNRKGGFNKYRLFLFSDQLIYASSGNMIFQGEFKVHGQQNLSDMSVSDIDTDPMQCSVYIDHPHKSFMLRFESSLLKSQWLRDIHQTISNCIRRGALAAQAASGAQAGGGAAGEAGKNAAKSEQISSYPSFSTSSSSSVRSGVTSNPGSPNKSRLSVDLAKESSSIVLTRRPSGSGGVGSLGSITKSPRRILSGKGIISSPMPDGPDPRLEAQIASQSLLLRQTLNNPAERPQRLSNSNIVVGDIGTMVGAGSGASNISSTNSMAAYNERVLSSREESPKALATRSGGMENYSDKSSSNSSDAASDLSSDSNSDSYTDGDIIEDIWAGRRNLSARNSADLSKDENYAAL